MIDETMTGQASPEPTPGGSGSIPELEKFIFSSDRFTNEVVPRRLDPAKVAKFIIDRVTEKEGLKVMVQTEKAAAFYDTFEIAPKFRQFLNRSESGDEAVLRSIVIARTIARVGKPEDVQFANDYYAYLAGRIESAVEFEHAIGLYEVLGGDPAPVRRKLAAKLGSLGPKKETDEQARLEYLTFEEKITQRLNRAVKANETKAKIIAIADRQKRIEEEIKVYLAVGYGYIEFLEPWSAARLRREAWAAQPSEQVVRPEKPQLRDDVARIFRSMVEKLDSLGPMDSEEKESAKIKLLRAVKFFGGSIGEQDEAFLIQFKGTQADLLANEGFLLE